MEQEKPQAVIVERSSEKDVEANKDAAALGYVWILSVLIYITRRDSAFVRFHARQGMVLFALSIPVWFIPYAGRLLELPILALAVIGFLAAARGEWKELPVIGRLTQGDILHLFSGIVPKKKPQTTSAPAAQPADTGTDAEHDLPSEP